MMVGVGPILLHLLLAENFDAPFNPRVTAETIATYFASCFDTIHKQFFDPFSSVFRRLAPRQ